MRIDSHVHFWKYQPETYSWIDDSMKLIQKDFLPEDFETVMNSNGIDGCILVQAVQSEAETEFLLKLSAENNLVKGVVGWVDFSSEKVEEKLEKYSKNKIFKGVRHTVYDERGEFLENPEFQNGISLLEKFGLTYDILVFDFQLAAAINLVEKFPRQKFILDHVGKPQVSKGVSEEWKMNISALAKHPNVYCKMSGLFSEAEDFQWNKKMLVPFIRIIFDVFGDERILFGSNWPVSLCATDYSETYGIIESFLGPDRDSLKLVMGENSEKFYGI